MLLVLRFNKIQLFKKKVNVKLNIIFFDYLIKLYTLSI